MWIVAGLTALFVALHRRPGSAVVALLIAALAASLAQAIVLSALPVLGREMHAPATEVAWVLTAFMLASAVATPIAGRLGDLFGYRRVLFGCLAFLAVGALVAAVGTVTHSLGVLVTGRVLQGVSGGVFPLAFGIVRAIVPSPRLPGVIALLSAMFGIGGAAGLVVAGVLIDSLGTAWLSWGTLVLAVVALVTATALPATSPPGAGRVDLVGAALLSAALVCLLLTISQGRAWGFFPAVMLGVLAAALFAVFTMSQLRRRDPLVDIRLLRRPALATTNVATLVVAAAMFGGVTLVPQFLQTQFAYTPTEAGLLLLPMAAAMLVASPLAARIGRRHARLPLLLGAASAAVAFGVLTVAHAHLWQFVMVGVLIGVGYGLAFASVGNLVVNAVEPRHTGLATGVNTITRTVGGAVGAQLAAAMGSSHVTAFAVFGIVAVAAVGTAFAIPMATVVRGSR